MGRLVATENAIQGAIAQLPAEESESVFVRLVNKGTNPASEN